MYPRANYFPQSISLTTKTWLYPNLVMPPHSGEKAMNKVREAGKVIKKEILFVFLCCHHTVSLVLHLQQKRTRLWFWSENLRLTVSVFLCTFFFFFFRFRRPNFRLEFFFFYVSPSHSYRNYSRNAHNHFKFWKVSTSTSIWLRVIWTSQRSSHARFWHRTIAKDSETGPTSILLSFFLIY